MDLVGLALSLSILFQNSDFAVFEKSIELREGYKNQILEEKRKRRTNLTIDENVKFGTQQWMGPPPAQTNLPQLH